MKYKKLIKRINDIEEILFIENDLTQNELESHELYQEWDKLTNELRIVDPWNDRFHIGCKHWPNCEDYGCGEL